MELHSVEVQRRAQPTAPVAADACCLTAAALPNLALLQVEGMPGGGSLSSRFDSLAGVAPSGPARPTGAPRRNAHGVVLP